MINNDAGIIQNAILHIIHIFILTLHLTLLFKHEFFLCNLRDI